jgi:hypothetical protein
VAEFYFILFYFIFARDTPGMLTLLSMDEKSHKTLVQMDEKAQEPLNK